MPKVPIDYTSIFIGQLDRSTSEYDVRERFGKYGTVVGVQVLAKAAVMGRGGGGGRGSENGVTGFAFVKFENREGATKAVKAEVWPRIRYPEIPLSPCKLAISPPKTPVCSPFFLFSICFRFSYLRLAGYWRVKD
jgi:RNA recognition motif-containing protein